MLYAHNCIHSVFYAHNWNLEYAQTLYFISICLIDSKYNDSIWTHSVRKTDWQTETEYGVVSAWVNVYAQICIHSVFYAQNFMHSVLYTQYWMHCMSYAQNCIRSVLCTHNCMDSVLNVQNWIHSLSAQNWIHRYMYLVTNYCSAI